MQKTIAIIKREYNEYVKKKSFWILTILSPVLMIAIMFIPLWLASMNSNKKYNVYIISNDRIAKQLENTKKENINFIIPEKNFTLFDLKEEVIKNKKIDAILAFNGDVTNINAKANLYMKNTANFELTTIISEIINNIVVNERFKLNNIPENVKSLLKKVDIETIKITKEGETKSDFGISYLIGISLALIMHSSILGYGNTLMKGIIDEKNSHIMKILISSVKSSELMFGKILGTFLGAITQIVIWILMFLIAYFYGFHSNPLLLNAIKNINIIQLCYFAIFFLLGYIFYSAIFAAIGAIFNSNKEAQQVTMIISYIMIIPIILAMLFAKEPNGLVARVLTFFPFTTSMAVIMRVGFELPPIFEIIGAIIILLISILIVIYLASKIFRVGILMQGKNPTPREVLKWLSY